MAEFTEITLLDAATESPFAIDGRLIDFGPPPGSIEEIAQNVRTLLRTAIWSVPLDRMIGIDYRFLDLPSPVAQMQIQVELFQKINFYEPRVAASDIRFAGDGQTGYLEPTVKLEFRPEALPPERRRQLALPG
jgi:phage baseplate assembly protein W